MATGKRRRKKNNTGLKALIGILAAILVIVLVIALTIDSRQDDPTLNSAPPGQTGAASTGITTEPTTESTAAPTVPPLTGWVEEDGKTYYFDQGTPYVGAAQIDGTLYCFGTDGALLSPGWQEVGGSTYYLNADGSAYLGWLTLEEDLYYLRTDGTMARGAEEIDGDTYYFTSAGCHIYVVNPWNYVPEGYDPELVALSTTISKEDSKVSASCYDALMDMMTDCMDAGHSVYIVSSYRTQEYQEYLFNRQVSKQMSYGYSREEAEIIAATVSAIPGTSEHQLGLAVDIIDTEIWDLVEQQEDLAGQQWLMENCWRYGFILRYPKDKTDETGIIYEPWHYRYVGLEVAAELHESGQTLEAYLKALS